MSLVLKPGIKSSAVSRTILYALLEWLSDGCFDALSGVHRLACLHR
jgi:hypothetical protein